MLLYRLSDFFSFNTGSYFKFFQYHTSVFRHSSTSSPRVLNNHRLSNQSTASFKPFFKVWLGLYAKIFLANTMINRWGLIWRWYLGCCIWIYELLSANDEFCFSFQILPTRKCFTNIKTRRATMVFYCCCHTQGHPSQHNCFLCFLFVCWS